MIGGPNEGACLQPSKGELSTIASFSDCFTFEHLLQAANDCAKGVGFKQQPQEFMINRLLYCKELLKQLYDGTYSIAERRSVTIRERGKWRQIRPVSFKDRVVMNCLAEYVVIPLIECTVIKDSSACIRGRGGSYMEKRLRRYVSIAPPDAWVLQYDFKSFFASINKEILFNQLRPRIVDKRTMGLMESLINSERGGLELGSHISQLCATMYPTPLDIAMEQTEGCVGYHRYMDDGVVIYDTREHALIGRTILGWEALNLDLTLNPKKTYINSLHSPFVFCKRRFTKTRSGCKVNICKRHTRNSTQRLKRVIKLAERNPKVDPAPAIASVRGYVNSTDPNLDRVVDEALRSIGH